MMATFMDHSFHFPWLGCHQAMFDAAHIMPCNFAVVNIPSLPSY
jgi:hypothetical protein